jgi:hypothetical protein
VRGKKGKTEIERRMTGEGGRKLNRGRGGFEVGREKEKSSVGWDLVGEEFSPIAAPAKIL